MAIRTACFFAILAASPLARATGDGTCDAADAACEANPGQGSSGSVLLQRLKPIVERSNLSFDEMAGVDTTDDEMADRTKQMQSPNFPPIPVSEILPGYKEFFRLKRWSYIQSLYTPDAKFVGAVPNLILNQSDIAKFLNDANPLEADLFHVHLKKIVQAGNDDLSVVHQIGRLTVGWGKNPLGLFYMRFAQQSDGGYLIDTTVCNIGDATTDGSSLATMSSPSSLDAKRARSAINPSLSQFSDFFNNRSWAELAGLYAPDAVLIPPEADQFILKSGVQAFWENWVTNEFPPIFLSEAQVNWADNYTIYQIVTVTFQGELPSYAFMRWELQPDGSPKIGTHIVVIGV